MGTGRMSSKEYKLNLDDGTEYIPASTLPNPLYIDGTPMGKVLPLNVLNNIEVGERYYYSLGRNHITVLGFTRLDDIDRVIVKFDNEDRLIFFSYINDFWNYAKKL